VPHPDFPPGTVWLVGAGPGDPELLSRKAERLIREADILFHDALVGPAILDLARPGAILGSVGKRSGRHSKDQATIDRLIVDAALAGLKVVRLKGGDPGIFGRTGEELAACAAHGVPVRICPGITAASAAAAAAGAPLTLRGSARTITFLTAHTRAGQLPDQDWAAHVRLGGTLGIYMGRAAAPDVAAGLMAAGLAPETPVLVAVDISMPGERLLRGRLDALAFLVRTISDEDPTLLLIGEAVAPAHMPERTETAAGTACTPA
jgi:uroporphyrin-III C-methyltransferase